MVKDSTCPSEEQLQRYILDPDLPDQGMIGDHLEECAYCRFLIDRLQDNLQELQTVWIAATDAGTVTLEPFQIGDSSESPATTLLAAQGESDEEEARSLTLVSPDKRLLLRAVRDSQSGELWLYLLSDDPKLCRRVLVRPFGFQEELLSDERGRINLGPIDWPEDDMLTAQVRYPRAVFELSPKSDFTQPSATARLSSPSGDTIEVSFEGMGRNRKLNIRLVEVSNSGPASPLKVAVRAKGSPEFLHLQQFALDQTSFDGIEAKQLLEIYIYQ